jgi:hypothetical protein
MPCLAQHKSIRGLQRNSGQVFAVCGRTHMTLLLARRLLCRSDVLILVSLTLRLLRLGIRRPDNEVHFAGIGS